VVFEYPFGDGLIYLVQMAGEKMVRAVHKDKTRVSSRAGHDLFDLIPGSMLVVGALHNQLGFGATLEESEIRCVHGNA